MRQHLGHQQKNRSYKAMSNFVPSHPNANNIKFRRNHKSTKQSEQTFSEFLGVIKILKGPKMARIQSKTICKKNFCRIPIVNVRLTLPYISTKLLPTYYPSWWNHFRSIFSSQFRNSSKKFWSYAQFSENTFVAKKENIRKEKMKRKKNVNYNEERRKQLKFSYY